MLAETIGLTQLKPALMYKKPLWHKCAILIYSSSLPGSLTMF